MMLPLLIIGASGEKRKDKALATARQTSSTFDISVVDTQEEAGINIIRDLGQKLTLRPFESSQQTVIILEAQNLTIEAQNAFLKNLEESGPSVQIILTAPTAASLLSTVASRCQKFDLPITNEETAEADWQFFKDFLKKSYYEQYTLADKLDLETWLLLWRKILLATVGLEKLPFSFETNAAAIVRYIKLINKMRSLRKRRAAARLLKTILILEAPKIEASEQRWD